MRLPEMRWGNGNAVASVGSAFAGVGRGFQIRDPENGPGAYQERSDRSAAALGLRRDETEPLTRLAQLRFGVRAEREGQLLVDFHMARNEEKDRSYVTYRHYLEDAVFLVGLESEDTALLQELAEALTHPVFPLYLGRRACPPTLPLCLGLREQGLVEALQAEPALCPGEPKPTRIVADAAPQEPGAVPQRDVPLSYDPRHRQYGYRSAREISLRQPAGAPEPTAHDPFCEL